MTGIQNAVYKIAFPILSRLVGRHYTPSPQVLAIEADIVALHAKTIRKAREIVGHIETLAEMRKNDTADRDSNLWALVVKQTEADWNATRKPKMLAVSPQLRGQAKDVIAKTEAALRALKVAGLH